MVLELTEAVCVFSVVRKSHSSHDMTRGHPQVNSELCETKSKTEHLKVRTRKHCLEMICNPKNRGSLKALIHAWYTHINPHAEHVMRQPIECETLIRHRPYPTLHAIPSLNCARMALQIKSFDSHNEETTILSLTISSVSARGFHEPSAYDQPSGYFEL